MGYIVKHTVPVYVEVNPDTGEVDRVVVDDEHLSHPVGYVSARQVEAGWTDDDVYSWRRSIMGEARFRQYMDEVLPHEAWPAWKFGWD